MEMAHWTQERALARVLREAFVTACLLALLLTCLRSRLIQDMETVRETQHIPVSALLAESLPA